MARESDASEDVSYLTIVFAYKQSGKVFDLEHNLNHQQVIDFMMSLNALREKILEQLPSRERLKYVKLEKEWERQLNDEDDVHVLTDDEDITFEEIVQRLSSEDSGNNITIH